MTTLGIRVENARELRAELKWIGGTDLVGELKATHRTVSELIVAAALPNAPVGTGPKAGRLRGSVKALASLREARAKIGVAYAASVHWGRRTGNVGSPPGNHPGRNVIVGRPFLWDAAKKVEAAAIALYEREVTALINRRISR